MSRNGVSQQSIGAFDLQRYLARQTSAVDCALDNLLPPAHAKPATIHKAMRYSLFAVKVKESVPHIDTFTLSLFMEPLIDRSPAFPS